MRGNLLTGTCDHECRKTWRVEHGGALPGGPWPGDYAKRGDVRRCPHGKVWLFKGTDASLHFNMWRRLSRWWEPDTYRRALKALGA